MTSATSLRHLRPIVPLSFPASDPEWEMGQSGRHNRLCELLYQIVRQAVGDGSAVGADMFLYFDASNPRRKCAPDVFVKLGVPHALIDSWKLWEHGAPELAVEILSPSDSPEKLTWQQKMDRYHAIGVKELVAFEVEAPEGARLRAWDRIENDLVERAIEGERTPCLTLGLHWVIVPAIAPSGEALSAALRLARDPEGQELVLTRDEAARAAAEAEIKTLRAALEDAKR